MTLEEKDNLKVGDILKFNDNYYDLDKNEIVVITKILPEKSFFLKMLKSKNIRRIGQDMGRWGFNIDDEIECIEIIR